MNKQKAIDLTRSLGESIIHAVSVDGDLWHTEEFFGDDSTVIAAKILEATGRIEGELKCLGQEYAGFGTTLVYFRENKKPFGGKYS